jgi:hypothetical protein
MNNKKEEKGNSTSSTIKVLPQMRVEHNESTAHHKLMSLSFDPKLLSEMIIQLFPGQYA